VSHPVGIDKGNDGLRSAVGLMSLTLLATMSILLASCGAKRPETSMKQGDSGSSKALAERLLARSVFGTVVRRDTTLPTPSEPHVELVVGRIPQVIGNQFPVPSGSSVLGTALYWREPSVPDYEVVLDVPEAPADVLSYFEREMRQLCWRLITDSSAGSFASITRGFCKTGDNRPIWIVVGGTVGGTTDVRIIGDSRSRGDCE
jgi:hypothetical protein